MRAASATCWGAAVVLSSTSSSRSSLTKSTLSRSTCALSSFGITGLSTRFVVTLALSTPIKSAPARAVPTPPARLLAAPRSEATSPASAAGAAAARTLNRTVTSAPCPNPMTISPKITVTVCLVANDHGQQGQPGGYHRERDTCNAARAEPIVQPRDKNGTG